MAVSENHFGATNATARKTIPQIGHFIWKYEISFLCASASAVAFLLQ